MGFENAANYNRWQERDKRAWFLQSVTGPAVTLLWGDHCAYAVLVERLRKRYGSRGLEQKYRTELRCRKRRQGESLRELCQDIHRLMGLAFPGESGLLADHIATDIFLSALEPDLEYRVRSEAPPNLDDALKWAIQIEMSR